MGPLEGLKVVEMAGIGPCPFAGMLLADLGARVTRIDRTGESGLGIAIAPQYDLMNRGKRSIALDLKSAEGTELALDLIAASDVLIEGFRPGVMERFGLGPHECFTRQPALVYGRVTGWGQEGPLAQTAGHDINYIALTGALGGIGTASQPLPPLNLIGDFGGGSMFLVVGVLAALLEARVSGRGQVVDAAIVDGVALLGTMFHGLLAAGLWKEGRGVNLLDGGAPWYGCYATRDGRHVAVGALEPKFYDQLVERLGFGPGELPDRSLPASLPVLREKLAERIATRTLEEWSEAMAGSDACLAPVLGWGEAVAHPHNAARDAYVSIEGIPQPAPAPRFGRSAAAVPERPSMTGDCTRAILLDAGLASDQVDALIRRGIVMARD